MDPLQVYKLQLTHLAHCNVKPEEVIELGQQAGIPQKQLQEDVKAASIAGKQFRQRWGLSIL